MNASEEKALDKKVDQHFRSHRELPNGRDYRWNTYRWITEDDRDNFRKNFDSIFPNAPGSGL